MPGSGINAREVRVEVKNTVAYYLMYPRNSYYYAKIQTPMFVAEMKKDLDALMDNSPTLQSMLDDAEPEAEDQAGPLQQVAVFLRSNVETGGDIQAQLEELVTQLYQNRVNPAYWESFLTTLVSKVKFYYVQGLG